MRLMKVWKYARYDLEEEKDAKYLVEKGVTWIEAKLSEAFVFGTANRLY